MTHKNITNAHFVKLKDVINTCVGSHLNGASIISNMQNASFDKENSYYVYPSTSPVNMDVIKLDELTEYRKYFLLPKIHFEPLPGVDAICINNQNEWFFIEFKNSNVKNQEIKRSLKKKMINSLWYVFFLYSMAGEDIVDLFNGDITKFARENINYVIVGSQIKNMHYQINIHAAESVGKHYTPPGFEQFKGYYFKDVYMLTEIELRDFILNFKA